MTILRLARIGLANLLTQCVNGEGLNSATASGVLLAAHQRSK